MWSCRLAMRDVTIHKEWPKMAENKKSAKNAS